ncbi:MAG: acyltransferase [Bacteroidota bacterium]
MKQLLRDQLAKVREERDWTHTPPLAYLLLLWRLGQLVVRWLRARWALFGSTHLGKLVFVRGQLHIDRQGELRIGERVRFWSTIAPTHLKVTPRAKLHIANDCFVNGSIIAAHESITIAKGSYIAPMVQIADSYCFGLRQATQQTAPITIAEDAWIATRAIIRPGVRVGKGAVVGVGAVVENDVPDYAIVGGVPARVIRYLKSPSQR